eukprot:750851-Hanusia_phi.AAC.4
MKLRKRVPVLPMNINKRGRDQLTSGLVGQLTWYHEPWVLLGRWGIWRRGHLHCENGGVSWCHGNRVGVGGHVYGGVQNKVDSSRSVRLMS